jgi:hypothetical protein
MTKNISKVLFMLGLALLVGASSFAQTIAPQSVNSAGVKMTQSNGSLSFTVGELVVLTQIDANGNSLGGGFTNSSTISTTVLSVQEPDAAVLQVSIFPNPTTDLVQLQIKEANIDEMELEFSDLTGKILYSAQYRLMNQNIGINTAGYPSGVYLLTLKKSNGQILGTYKIVKHEK